MADNQDDRLEYYAILNVRQDASRDEIVRAYRSLAAKLHPDKHTTEALQQTAAEVFSRLQAAYEVLSDPEKRAIYDMYGRTGLEAGTELGRHYSTIETLLRDVELAQERQRLMEELSAVSNKGHFLCILDCTHIVHPYDTGVRMWPDLKLARLRNSSTLRFGSAAVMGGAVASLTGAGAGQCSVLFAANSPLGGGQLLSADAAVGSQTRFSTSSTQQLGPYSHATAALLYEPGVRPSIQLSHQQQLSQRWLGVCTVVLGPQLPSLGVGLERSGERASASVKLEVGAAWGLLFRCKVKLGELSSLRGMMRFGTTGVSVELGLGRQISTFTKVYAGVEYGLMGTVLRTRGQHGSHSADVVFLLSSSWQDWRVTLAAYTLPPLVGLAIHQLVAKPLRLLYRRYRSGQVGFLPPEVLAAIASARRRAKQEALVLRPLAQQKVAREVAVGGLVVVQASYGDLATYFDNQQHLQALRGRTRQAESPSEGEAPSLPGHERIGSPEAGESSSSAADSQEPDHIQPGPWLDVTTAVQCMVESGRLTLHQGLSKASLMGFADVAPEHDKQLFVLLLHQGQPHSLSVEDTEGAQLPAAAVAVDDAELRSAVLETAAALGLMPQ